LQLLFQPLESLADGRLGEEKVLGRNRMASCIGNGKKSLEGSEFHLFLKVL
jgi:hypothetical protein